MAEREPSPGADQRRNSVSAKMIFLVVLCTFSTALVVSWISIQSTQRHLREGIERSFPALLRRTADAVGPWLAGGSEELKAIRRGEAMRAAEGIASGRWRDERTLERARQGLGEGVLASQHFDWLAIRGADGTWLASTPIEGLRGVALPTEIGTALAVAPDEQGHVQGFATVSLGPQGRAGHLVGRYRDDPLAALLTAGRLEEPGKLAITDRDGQVVVLAKSPEPSAPGDFAHSVARLREAPSGAIVDYPDALGRHVLGSALPLGLDAENDWLVVIEASHDVAFAPLVSVVKQIFVGDLIILLVFSTLAYRVTTRMMQPIESLSAGVRRISRGELDQSIPEPSSGDEIGLLARTFNEMMEKLRFSKVELQAANRQLQEQNDELQRANEVLSQLSITDGLTKLHNHRYFQERLTREIKRRGRKDEPLSMLLVDLDDFKQLNDRLGHAAGDELLVRIAAILDAAVRETDLLARYGGEEFVVLATDTDLEGAVALAEKIRMAIEEARHILNESLRPVRATVSIGVAQYAGNRRQFFESADRALYRAKGDGKNCVAAGGDEEPFPL